MKRVIKFINRNHTIQRCRLCNQASNKAVCSSCLDDLTDLSMVYPLALNNLLFHPSIKQTISCRHYDLLKALAPYEYPWSFFIKQFKFCYQLDYGTLLATEFYRRILSFQSDNLPQGLIAVPLHPYRYVKRQFNQSHYLASFLAKQLSIPLITGCLTRREHGIAKSLTAKRAHQAPDKSAFYAHPGFDFKSIALIDDVLTTGKTVDGCCLALKQAYPQLKIEVWVMCLTEFHPE